MINDRDFKAATVMLVEETPFSFLDSEFFNSESLSSTSR